MAETATPTVATNIAQSIQDKANGKAPAAPPANGQVPPVNPTADINAGKEKYVVDGKEVWLSPEQRTAWIQKGMAFEPKVTQFGHLQREVSTLLNDLKDPSVALKKLKYAPLDVVKAALSSGEMGDDVKEYLGKWYYENAVAPLKMTPEERRIAEVEKENKTFKDRDAAAKEFEIKMENQRRVDLALGQIKANIGEAMKESGLPDNDSPLGTLMARRVADKMRLAFFQRQTITPKLAIEQVRSELKQMQTAWYDSLDEDNLVKELGETNAKKVQKYYLKLVKEADKKPIDNSAPRIKRDERKTISLDDFHDQLAELKKKG